jgi:hypothetical protein
VITAAAGYFRSVGLRLATARADAKRAITQQTRGPLVNRSDEAGS